MTLDGSICETALSSCLHLQLLQNWRAKCKKCTLYDEHRSHEDFSQVAGMILWDSIEHRSTEIWRFFHSVQERRLRRQRTATSRASTEKIKIKIKSKINPPIRRSFHSALIPQRGRGLWNFNFCFRLVLEPAEGPALFNDSLPVHFSNTLQISLV